jgi:quercetin dioxygenase-like cupin family protein
MNRFLASVVTVIFSSAAFVAGQQTPVAPEEEPHHHVVLKNDAVIVIRATLQPGESTLYHTHSRDTADVELTWSTTTEQLFGKEEGAPETSHVGDVSADSAKEPITHRVHNVGKAPMDIFHVEFLHRPAMPSNQAAAPVAAENASARVYNWIIAPGASTPIHSHQRPYLIVAATPMSLKMTAPDERSLSEDVKFGDFHWIDAKVTHSLANAGGEQGQIVEIELK